MKIWADDVDTAWRYLVSQPGVNGDVTGLGGAGVLGVDNAVLTARRHSTEVKSLVLLSGETFLPGQQFLRQASQLLGLFVVADDDEGPPTGAYLADGQKDQARQTAEKALALLDSHTAPASPWSDTEARRKSIRDGA